MSFAVAAFIVGFSCAIITAKVLLGYNSFSVWLKIPLATVIFAAWFTPVILGFVRRHRLIDDMDVYAGLSNFMYYLFGLAFIIFCLLMARDIVWFAAHGIAKLIGHAPEYLDPKNPRSLGISNVVVLFVSLLISFYGVYQAVKVPEVRELNISSPKILKPAKIVLLSDLHINRTSSRKRLEKIIDRVNGLKPDVVVLAGDIIDDRLINIHSKLNVLKKIKASEGVYSVLGNHDLWAGIPAWFMKFGKLGLHPLINKGERLDKYGIFIAGVPDAWIAMFSQIFQYNFKSALRGSQENDYKILLSHSPKINLQGNKFDLQLSGHTHGGQIFPFHILAKHNNKYLAGHYKDGDMDIYVSRGTGYWGPAMRILAPSEITLINLTPEK